jgi:hypothetical protein
MLGSSHDGEVLAAARAAQELLRAARMTWHDAVNPTYHNTPQPSQSYSDPPSPSFADKNKISFCLEWSDELTDWEYDFILSISRRAILTAKQDAVLNRIWRKCQSRQNEAA